MMFFQILGGTSAPEYAPYVNGFALAVWIYVAANISGGHLNPAVSFSTAVCGFYPVIHTVIYIALQIIGAIVGAWVTAGLVPGASSLIGTGATGPGCFDRSVIKDVTDGQVFGWECVMTFTPHFLRLCLWCGQARPRQPHSLCCGPCSSRLCGLRWPVHRCRPEPCSGPRPQGCLSMRQGCDWPLHWRSVRCRIAGHVCLRLRLRAWPSEPLHCQAGFATLLARGCLPLDHGIAAQPTPEDRTREYQ